MRDIKFRAWQKSTNYLPNKAGTMWSYKEVSDDYLVTFDGNILEKYEDSGFGETWMMYRDVSDNFKLMQYTGLKDKNGVEIYEGDILGSDEIFDADDGKEYYYSPGIVTWWDNNARFHLSDDLEGYMGDDEHSDEPMEWKSYEVIGNIYENPELLNNTIDL